MPAKMTTEEVHAFLDSHPGWITLTTNGRDGYPHSIPINYFRLGTGVVIGCHDNTQKVVNIRRNPKVSLSLESGATMRDIKGVLIQGDATVVTGEDEVLRLTQETARRRGVPEGQLPQTAPPNAAYIVVIPRKTVSWDYSREE